MTRTIAANHRAQLLALGLHLALALACARPATDPWSAQLAEAQEQRLTSIPESDRTTYAAGFQDGAAMVNQARKAGLRPYRPMVGLAQAPLAWRSPLPEGVVADPMDPCPEVDAETGLLAFPASGALGESYARGQADGFTWALQAVGAALVRPLAPAGPPKGWIPWQDRPEGVLVEDGSNSARLFWSPGRLSWSWVERGFPAQRGWRVWGDPETPVWVGVSGRTLWIELKRGKVLALDPATGGILRIEPAPPHAAPVRHDYQKMLDADAAAWRNPQYQADLLRLETAAASGALADFLAVIDHLRHMGPEADRRAFPWQLKAAEAGHPGSMMQVGVAYFHGGVVKADAGLAAEWLDRAIRAGQPMAAEVKALLFQTPK